MPLSKHPPAIFWFHLKIPFSPQRSQRTQRKRYNFFIISANFAFSAVNFHLKRRGFFITSCRRRRRRRNFLHRSRRSRRCHYPQSFLRLKRSRPTYPAGGGFPWLPVRVPSRRGRYCWKQYPVSFLPL